MSEGAAKKGFGEKPQAKEKPRKFQAIRGTRDLLPPETALWNRVEQTAHEVFATFGFGEIRPPIIEDAWLFARSIGSETDIVSKEMYSFELQAFQEIHHLQSDLLNAVENPVRFTGHLYQLLGALRSAWDSDRIEHNPSNKKAIQELNELYEHIYEGIADDRVLQKIGKHPEILNWIGEAQSLAMDIEVSPDTVVLRPEATASVCRAYIEHSMQQLPQPVKLYYMGPMFRRERPQKGRYRQFYQIGAEVLGGGDAPAIDAEVIEMVMTFFDRLELQGVQLEINSIGDRNCRPKYVELLRAELLKVKDKLGPDSQRRIETNPLRVLDSKVESEQAVIEKLPRIGDHLCDECRTHYAAVKRELDLRGVKYYENWRLVRGLDYYMRTTFEITAKGLGSQNAVCGGGRYDGLVELLGGPPTKGIGFAIGEDRLILSLQESGKGAATQGRDVYIAWMGEKAYTTAIRAAKNLREAGFSVELPPVEQKFGKALGQADKLGARFALILGDNEVASGEWTVKTLADGAQQKLSEPDLLNFVKREKEKADPSLPDPSEPKPGSPVRSG
ncbi:MAG TPA: histidine--tRNA ligase [Candidatus Acidoferrum sp.]|nr:histidine--tRNA ligase [Candidatus Acidoferrum sp.]